MPDPRPVGRVGLFFQPANPLLEPPDLGLNLLDARALEEPLEHVLGVKRSQVDPEQAVEIRELKLIERAHRRGTVGLAQLLGDLPHREAAVLERLKAAKLRGRKRPHQPLDRLGIRLCAGRLVLLGVDVSLESGMRPDETQVGGLASQDQRREHVRVARDHGESPCRPRMRASSSGTGMPS